MDALNTDSVAVTILGSTGSIGENTLEVIAKHQRYRVFALTAFDSVQRMFKQCLKFNPRYAVLADAKAAQQLSTLLADTETVVLSGTESLVEVASNSESQVVMAAIVGAAGLESTLAAVKAGKKVLLANKESLVMAGELFMQSVNDSNAVLLPIDSEHNAIFQCLPSNGPISQSDDLSMVQKIILTASGGPFLTLPLDEFASITPDQACNHPRWDMGRKISVDSATLMNKGLEYIEACIMFGLETDQVKVLIHPQSIVHSMVEYCDGSVIAQMATPDMKIPIAYGLAWPERINSGAKTLDLASEQALEFKKPDLQRFPCLQLGMEAAAIGGSTPAILNAANEVAVLSFLDNRLPFSQIYRINEAVMSKIPCEAAGSLDIIRNADEEARILANELIAKVNH